MKEFGRYVELGRAYEHALLIEGQLWHLQFGLWVYQDEIRLERIHSPKTLVAFAARVDRLVNDFESSTRKSVEVIASLDDLKFAEFSGELTSAVKQHHGLIVESLDPTDGSMEVVRSKWFNDGRADEHYLSRLTASRKRAHDANVFLCQQHTFLHNMLEDAAEELNSLGRHFHLESVHRSNRVPTALVVDEESQDG
ncbi:MAG: hypothetical protein H6822_19710 [Planctomycetaceae bacterium]|nr:hypothetical protein [Planctomycetales bacterium]MCB9924415.1 hypothetical protein [Planctomycetaceae bacterium]